MSTINCYKTSFSIQCFKCREGGRGRSPREVIPCAKRAGGFPWLYLTKNSFNKKFAVKVVRKMKYCMQLKKVIVSAVTSFTGKKGR